MCLNSSQEVVFRAYVALASAMPDGADRSSGGGPPLLRASDPPWGVMECLISLLKATCTSRASSLEAMAQQVKVLIWPEDDSGAGLAVEGGKQPRGCSGAYGCAMVCLIAQIAEPKGMVLDGRWLAAAIKLLAEKSSSLKARVCVMASVCKVLHVGGSKGEVHLQPM